MRLHTRLAASISRSWVRVYTAGLRATPKADRRALIESDLWEQAHDPEWARATSLALSIVARMLAGIPSDLAWRFETRRTQARAVVAAGGADIDPTPPESPQSGPILSLLAGLAWAMVLVNLVSPLPHSLAFAGAMLAVVALGGWALEARSQPDDEPQSSFWPLALAGALSAMAGGLILRWEFGGLLASAPFAAIVSRAWFQAPYPRGVVNAEAPVTGEILRARAAAGDVIAFEQPAGRQVSRRSLLTAGVWVGLGATLAASVGTLLDYLWERKPGTFGGIVTAGPVDQFPPGSKTKIQEGKFWLVNLTAEQGGPGFLALWQKCPHLGCTVPWEESFRFTDPDTGRSTRGWFRCPCHQSTYNHAGVLVYGPAPRSMDRMQVEIDASSGAVQVDTGRIGKGAPDNARYAVAPPPLG